MGLALTVRAAAVAQTTAIQVFIVMAGLVRYRTSSLRSVYKGLARAGRVQLNGTSILIVVIYMFRFVPVIVSALSRSRRSSFFLQICGL